MMKPVFLAAMICLGLMGCDAKQSSRADGLALSVIKLDGRVPISNSQLSGARYAISSIEVTVPASLQVSEANLIYPKADIVWRGEPQGDRLAQVKLIVDQGLAAGTADLKQGPSAILSVQLERFHALTEKARFSVGGTHDVVFLLTITDPQSGAVLEGPRRVEVAIKASGSNAAIAEDAAGRTQRVVIVEGLAEAIRRELSGPLSAELPKKRGLFAGFN